MLVVKEIIDGLEGGLSEVTTRLTAVVPPPPPQLVVQGPFGTPLQADREIAASNARTRNGLVSFIYDPTTVWTAISGLEFQSTRTRNPQNDCIRCEMTMPMQKGPGCSTVYCPDGQTGIRSGTRVRGAFCECDMFTFEVEKLG